jgi:hypothetical protein
MSKVKVRKSKYVVDEELGHIEGVNNVKQVAETEEAYNDILKDATITRVANKGDKFITENIAYNVLEIEADYDYPVYKYIYEGKEYFSNFKFANYIECVNPETIN